MADPSSDKQPIRSEFATDPEMKELVELFLQDLPGRIDSIQKAQQAFDFETLKRMSHQLRGASAGYGFPTLGKAAGALEDRLRSLATQVQADPKALSQIGNELTQLIDMCRRAAA